MVSYGIIINTIIVTIINTIVVTIRFAHLMEKVLATENYCTSIHEAVLWDLTSKEAQMVFIACWTGIKISWDIPRSTHSYSVQEVLTPGLQSLEQRILKEKLFVFDRLGDSRWKKRKKQPNENLRRTVFSVELRLREAVP